MKSGTHRHHGRWGQDNCTRRVQEGEMKSSPHPQHGWIDGWMDGGREGRGGELSKAAFFGRPFSFSFYVAFFPRGFVFIQFSCVHTYIHIFSQFSPSPILTLINPPPPANRPRPTGRSSPPCRLGLSPRPRSRRCRPRRRCGPMPSVLRIRLRSHSRACSLHSHLRYHHD